MGRPKVKSISGNTYSKLGNRKNIKGLSFYQAADYDPEKNNVEDMANAMIRFENGASMLVDVSFTLHAKEDEIAVKLYGAKAEPNWSQSSPLSQKSTIQFLNITPQVDRFKL